MITKLVALVKIMVGAVALVGCSFTYIGGNGLREIVDEINNSSLTASLTSPLGKDEVITANIRLKNRAEFDVYKIYFSPTNDDDWGENLRMEGEVLEDGSIILFEENLTYDNATRYWDLKVSNKDGGELPFTEIDLLSAKDPENVTILIAFDEGTDNYIAIVE